MRSGVEAQPPSTAPSAASNAAERRVVNRTFMARTPEMGRMRSTPHRLTHSFLAQRLEASEHVCGGLTCRGTLRLGYRQLGLQLSFGGMPHGVSFPALVRR